MAVPGGIEPPFAGWKPAVLTDRRRDQNKIFYGKTYNLSSVLNNKVTVALQENDRIKIYSLEEVRGEQKVTISGFVSEPKTVFWSEKLSVFDLIFQSVSYDELEFQSKVLTSRLDLKRFDEQSGLYKISQYSIDKLEDLKTTYLMPKDEVVLYTKSVTEDITPTFRVLGKVTDPGEFSLGKSVYVEDAILMAGGFLEDAEKTFVNINRLEYDQILNNTDYRLMSTRFDNITVSEMKFYGLNLHGSTIQVDNELILNKNA